MNKEKLEQIYNSAIKWENIRKSGKSKACILVLELMDTEEYGNNYCASLECVLANYPEVDKVALEKELDKYV